MNTNKALDDFLSLAQAIQDCLDTPGTATLTEEERHTIAVSVEAVRELREEHEQMKKIVLNFSYHGIGCRAGGYAYKGDPEHPCICGLSSLRQRLKE